MGKDSPTIRFKGVGFHTWQTRIKLILMKKGLWVITSGKEKKPRDADLAVTWQRNDDKAQAIIKLELDDSYIHHVDACETSHETWERLDTLFGAQSKSSKYGLLIEFFRLDMKSHTSLASHLNYMESLLTQLAGIKLKMDDDVCIGVLLKSLPPAYDNVSTTLINMPNPKLVDIKASLLEEEKKLKTKEEPSTSKDEQMLYVGNNRYKGKKEQLFCDFCKRTGHTEKFCHARKRSQKAYLAAVKEDEDHGLKEEEEEEDHQDQKDKPHQSFYSHCSDRLF